MTRRINQIANEYTCKGLGKAVGKAFINLLFVLFGAVVILLCKLFVNIKSIAPVVQIKAVAVLVILGVMGFFLWNKACKYGKILYERLKARALKMRNEAVDLYVFREELLLEMKNVTA